MDEQRLRDRIRQLTDEEDRRLDLARLVDHYAESTRNQSYIASLILGESNQALASGLFGQLRDPKLEFWGGYEGAVRRMACFLPDYLEGLSLADLCREDLAILRCRYAKQATLGHRDFLGSLMGLGITRESVGDILIHPDLPQTDIVLSRQILPLVLLEYRSAGRTELEVEEIAPEELCVPEQAYEERTINVQSLRLDAVLAAAYNKSRSDAQAWIQSGRVMVRGHFVTKPDRMLTPGDTVVCRGLGKFVLAELGGQSRKGRTHALIRHFK